MENLQRAAVAVLAILAAVLAVKPSLAPVLAVGQVAVAFTLFGLSWSKPQRLALRELTEPPVIRSSRRSRNNAAKPSVEDQPELM